MHRKTALQKREERPGGCTGDDDLHELLEKAFALEKAVTIPRYFGIHDRLEIYRRTG